MWYCWLNEEPPSTSSAPCLYLDERMEGMRKHLEHYHLKRRVWFKFPGCGSLRSGDDQILAATKERKDEP